MIFLDAVWKVMNLAAGTIEEVSWIDPYLPRDTPRPPPFQCGPIDFNILQRARLMTIYSEMASEYDIIDVFSACGLPPNMEELRIIIAMSRLANTVRSKTTFPNSRFLRQSMGKVTKDLDILETQLVFAKAHARQTLSFLIVNFIDLENRFVQEENMTSTSGDLAERVYAFADGIIHHSNKLLEHVIPCSNTTVTILDDEEGLRWTINDSRDEEERHMYDGSAGLILGTIWRLLTPEGIQSARNIAFADSAAESMFAMREDLLAAKKILQENIAVASVTVREQQIVQKPLDIKDLMQQIRTRVVGFPDAGTAFPRKS